MKEKLKSYLEPNQKIRTVETIALVMLLLGSLFSYVRGTAALHKDPGELAYIETTTLARDFDAEDYDEDSTSCDVIFANEEGQLIKTYTYEDYENLKDESIDAYVYETDEGIKLFFDHKDPNPDVIKGVYRQTMATALMPVFNLANALIILAASVAVMLFYGKFFTAYEKSWFLGIMVLATIFAVLFPEESANGVNGIWIMLPPCGVPLITCATISFGVAMPDRTSADFFVVLSFTYWVNFSGTICISAKTVPAIS